MSSAVLMHLLEQRLEVRECRYRQDFEHAIPQLHHEGGALQHVKHVLHTAATHQDSQIMSWKYTMSDAKTKLPRWQGQLRLVKHISMSRISPHNDKTCTQKAL